VAGILIKNDKILLVEHKKNNKKYWLLPGGGQDYGESLKSALMREYKEELNIDVDVKDIVYIYESLNPKGRRHIVNICFSCDYIAGELKLSAERRLNGFGFFTADEIENLIIIPPFKKDLIRLLRGEHVDIDQVYLGEKWVKL
jgi:ADP-ribose pyrophosphatase YjhB (NUDIX family)